MLDSRIWSLLWPHRGRFLVGGRTVESLGADHPFSLRFIDLVAVQGKSEPAKIYQVLDAETPERKAALEASRGRLAEALDAYYARDFETCLRMCEEAAVADPHDAVPELFAERSRELIVSPPPADWNGTKVMQHK